jgi:hypothetical protein
MIVHVCVNRKPHAAIDLKDEITLVHDQENFATFFSRVASDLNVQEDESVSTSVSADGLKWMQVSK